MPQGQGGDHRQVGERALLPPLPGYLGAGHETRAERSDLMAFDELVGLLRTGIDSWSDCAPPTHGALSAERRAEVLAERRRQKTEADSLRGKAARRARYGLSPATPSRRTSPRLCSPKATS